MDDKEGSKPAFNPDVINAHNNEQAVNTKKVGENYSGNKLTSLDHPFDQAYVESLTKKNLKNPEPKDPPKVSVFVPRGGDDDPGGGDPRGVEMKLPEGLTGENLTADANAKRLPESINSPLPTRGVK